MNEEALTVGPLHEGTEAMIREAIFDNGAIERETVREGFPRVLRPMNILQHKSDLTGAKTMLDTQRPIWDMLHFDSK